MWIFRGAARRHGDNGERFGFGNDFIEPEGIVISEQHFGVHGADLSWRTPASSNARQNHLQSGKNSSLFLARLS